MLTDDDIARLTPDQRRDLIQRLGRPTEEIGPALSWLRRTGRVRLFLLAGAAALLVPWIGYLAWTLPRHYTAHHWVGTWVGFDVALVVVMVATVVLVLRRRMIAVLGAYTIAILLFVDAWFDVMTADPRDRLVSVLLAMLVELPFAVILVKTPLTVLRLTAMRFYRIEPGQSIWQIRFPLPVDGADAPVDRGRAAP